MLHRLNSKYTAFFTLGSDLDEKLVQRGINMFSKAEHFSQITQTLWLQCQNLKFPNLETQILRLSFEGPGGITPESLLCLMQISQAVSPESLNLTLMKRKNMDDQKVQPEPEKLEEDNKFNASAKNSDQKGVFEKESCLKNAIELETQIECTKNLIEQKNLAEENERSPQLNNLNDNNPTSSVDEEKLQRLKKLLHPKNFKFAVKLNQKRLRITHIFGKKYEKFNLSKTHIKDNLKFNKSSPKQPSYALLSSRQFY